MDLPAYNRGFENNYDETLIYWQLGLFVAGAFFAGVLAREFVPDDWPKYLRFACVMLVGGLGGGIPSYYAYKIRDFFYLAAGLAILAVVCQWVWDLV